MSMHVDLDGITCDEIIVDLKEHDAKVRSEGESIGITRVLDILESLDKQILEKVKDKLYEQDYNEQKEQKGMNRCKYNKFVGCNIKECATCEVYKVYQQGRADAIDEILKLPRNTYKIYEHGFIENEEAIFVSDILDLKEKKE